MIPTTEPTVMPTTPATAIPTTPATVMPTALPEATPITVPNVGAFTSGTYRNLFKEMLRKSDADIEKKIDAAWQQLFYGDDDFERVYYPVGDDMAYVMDIGNDDIRSEGMSYGMMLAVQMNKQAEFKRLWKWVKTYMYHTEGPYKGYFAWHNQPNGEKIHNNPASDGEEWFVMALLFASHRFGDGDGIFNYSAQAQEILDTMLHKEDGNSGIGVNMFNTEHKQVVFVPTLGKDSSFTDPSYHLPAYYELWAR
jgi:oligosaccharide reducing-end xylanase